MNMTHYMELLANNQPWNLLIFMAIPVILAETLAITELYILFTRNFNGSIYRLNRFSGTVVGIYFIGIIAYLITTAVIPITKAGQWRTVIDVIAVSTYLIGGLPLIWIALQEFGFVNRKLNQEGKLKIHAICVAVFLVFGHIAMITGMLDPALLGYKGDHAHATATAECNHSAMPEDMKKMNAEIPTPSNRANQANPQIPMNQLGKHSH
jgi:hypothetical protein